MATATIYSSAADSNYFGYGTYSTARETQYAAINDGTTSWIGQATWGASDNECDEFVCVFDLSSISSGQTVSNASMSIMISADNSATDFTLEARAVTSNAWVPGSSIASKTLLASKSTASIGTGAKTLTSEAALATAIQAALGGTLYVLLASSRQRTGDAPSGNEYIEIYTGNYSTQSYRPSITFDYEAGGGGIPLLNHLLLGD